MVELSVAFRRVSITPKYAQEILDKMEAACAAGKSVNRNVRQHRVDRYARDMEAGNWVENGESIKLDQEGVLKDGQHRLRAVVKSGCTIPMYFATVADDRAFSTIDTGMGRSDAFVLSVEGIKNGRTVAAVTTILWRNEEGLSPLDRAVCPSVKEKIELLAKYPEIQDAIRELKSFEDGTLPNSSVFIAVRVMTWENPKSQDFFKKLLGGEGLTKSSPAAALRTFLIRAKRSRMSMHPGIILALTVKAWNAFSSGEKIGTLKFMEKEKFPLIRNVK